MMLEDGGLFWIMIAVVGATTLGGALAMTMARERNQTEAERAANDAATRRLYAEEARDASR